MVAYAVHEQRNEHAERMLGLVDLALHQAGWQKGLLERIAVGVGPGSFTGLRIAVALGQGLMLGLSRPGVGVGSLAAVAAGLPGDDPRARVVVRDARRSEFFVAAYDRRGKELFAPCVVAQEGAASVVSQLAEGCGLRQGKWVVLGTDLEGLPCAQNEQTREPDARAVGRLAFNLQPESSPVVPHYVRGPNLVRPQLPVSPLVLPREAGS